jgi:hypothetical protein
VAVLAGMAWQQWPHTDHSTAAQQHTADRQQTDSTAAQQHSATAGREDAGQQQQLKSTGRAVGGS